MRNRGFTLLLAATVVLVAVAIYALAIGERAASPALAGERALPGLAAKLGELAWVRLSHGRSCSPGSISTTRPTANPPTSN